MMNITNGNTSTFIVDNFDDIFSHLSTHYFRQKISLKEIGETSTRQTRPKTCFLEITCHNKMTCNEFCRYRGYILGSGTCEYYVGVKDGHCCCSLNFESQEFFISHDTYS
ncbi:unnamed protein product [Thlaspi arvense]|uniref:Uncharacterized protein n=1 Tax=Thlaspi arvense TaxID=13288 RepID=A0AAU9T5F6_THLAR|nr:unnamed protein product [Thlaspi arvense]